MPIAQSLASLLMQSGLDRIEGRILLGHVLGRDRAWLVAHAGDAAGDETTNAFEALVRRRRGGEPIAYLVGRREFYGLDLSITSAVLIPRPETELLVELALARISPGSSARVLDLGSGSGAVALAIAHERPQASVVGVDASPAAIEVARANAARLGIGNVGFVESDWYAALPAECFDVIVANPPYIAEGDPHLGQGDLVFEPRHALTPGGDGLGALRHIILHAVPFLRRGGVFLTEHGYDQAAPVRDLLADSAYVDIASARDLSDTERVSFGSVGKTS